MLTASFLQRSVMLLTLVSCLDTCAVEAATVQVSTSSQLRSALDSVKPGDTIQLAAGTYTGPFESLRSGSSSGYINLQGPTSGSPAILTCGTVESGYGLHLEGVDYWRVKYLTVSKCMKGIVLDDSNSVLIHKVLVEQIGQEGIHLRAFSSNNRIQYSTLRSIGVTSPGIGEAIYIGSSVDNWDSYSDGAPDRSDYNLIQFNTIGPNVGAEAIDIKEGTTGTQVLSNVIDSKGLSGENGADCFIAVKGNKATISDNSAVNNSSTLRDGIQVYVKASGWGNNNVFRRNRLTVNAAGYGFWVESGATGNKVYTDNSATGAKSGLSNIPTSTRSAELDACMQAFAGG